MSKFVDAIKKFIDVISIRNWQIESQNSNGDIVWNDIVSIGKTVPYERYIVKFDDGTIIKCADNHIFIDEYGNEIFAKDSIGRRIKCKNGLTTVVDINNTTKVENMYDVQLCDDSNHLYYSNGILSHNTTIYTVFILWYAMFHPNKSVMICGNQLNIAIEIVDRIKRGYEYCPSAIKLGVVTYNKTCIEFENGSTIRCFATGSSGTRGFSAQLLVLDEAAFIPKHVADDFMASVFPVLSSDPNSKAIMVSTPNGTTNNVYYDIWQQATDPNVESTENWKPFRFLWYDVPGRDQKWKEQQIATIGMARWMQEFECEFKSSQDASLIPSDQLEQFRRGLKEYQKPAELNLSNNPDKDITAYFWKEFDPTRVYSSSGDISEGTGNDSSVINIWDVTSVKNIQLVARMSCSKATLVDFGYASYELLKMYGFPPFIVENNGVGAGFVDIMLNTYHFPKHRMFYEQSISSTGKYGDISYGVKSKNKTKLDACMFVNELVTTPEIRISIPDELLVNEMGTFVKKNTSNSITFAAKDKCHDDYMMTWIWGMYLLFADTIQQHYAVEKAFRTSMGRVLPDKIQYQIGLSEEEVKEILNSESHISVMSQLNGLEDHKVAKAPKNIVKDDELFYGNRQWGAGVNREFFFVNQGFDFGSGCTEDEAFASDDEGWDWLLK